ncbi:hypothetical protein B0J15DRAFT_532679 [Fusarium solani]|uniref:Uncharacterized protein n=1 Tax=Fusarium solani TaxID=169388 RepID=A0A9P9L1X6_FUSSL|nr:uncharacterized protein B0J15DRAFT_532679 [Fusarium solani]KAH7272463.1 hypothetical protein B0J15DRAFT_532679 [Fusarium solani]
MHRRAGQGSWSAKRFCSRRLGIISSSFNLASTPSRWAILTLVEPPSLFFILVTCLCSLFILPLA